jgi:hypothetical protein
MLSRAPLHYWVDPLKRPEFVGSRIRPFITGYSPGALASSDTRFVYLGPPGFRSSSSSARRTIRAEKQKPYKLVSKKGAAEKSRAAGSAADRPPRNPTLELEKSRRDPWPAEWNLAQIMICSHNRSTERPRHLGAARIGNERSFSLKRVN